MKIYGYAQASDYEDVKPVEEQVEAIQRRANEIEGTWVQCRVDRTFWASKTPSHSRLEFRKLLDELRPGDHLIVWRLDRIDANPFVLARAVEMLMSRKALLCILDFERTELNLDATTGPVFAMLLNAASNLFRSQRREGVKRALNRLKETGQAYTGHPPLGKRRTPTSASTASVPPVGAPV
ncbi:MAG: recombinase family protein [Planctomycetota bacterium]